MHPKGSDEIMKETTTEYMYYNSNVHSTPTVFETKNNFVNVVSSFLFH